MKKIILLVVVVVIGVGAWMFFDRPADMDQKSVSVEKISWHTELANPNIVDEGDYRKYEEAISIDVTFSDGSTKRYSLGKANGCDTTNVVRPPELGRMVCYHALVGVDFVAYYSRSGRFVVERHNESAQDGSIEKIVVLEI